MKRRLVVHTVREFASDEDWRQFVEYMEAGHHIPELQMKALKQFGHAQMVTMDGERGDCPAITVWQLGTEIHEGK